MAEPRSSIKQGEATEPDGPPSAGIRARVRIQLLGGFQVIVDDRVVPDGAWRTQKARSLVKLLALAPDHRIHREQVLDLLWPDLEPRAAANNLRFSLHAARRALESSATIGARSFLRLRDDLLVLDAADALWIDVDTFEAAETDARRRQDTASYQAALDLYTGELLPEDRYEDWAASRREALKETYLSLLVELAELHASRGAYPLAITTLEQAVAADATHEDAHARLMRLYALTGRPGQALRQYARLREALARELDVEPSATSRQLHAEIANGRFPPSGITPASVPAPPGWPSRVHNLPAPLSSFIGRAREVAELTELLADGAASPRLLTLTGAGGSGKSRLALEVGRILLNEYPEGVWLVELASLTDPALVPAAVAATVGVREQPGQALLETLSEALAARSLLLVLDNCEHLVDACASLIRTLLTSVPRLRVLATSREALRVPGEVAWQVPALSVPPTSPNAPPQSELAVEQLARSEAIALFVDRVRWVRPGFVLTSGNTEAVVHICRRLDGMPLAIELAAARVAVLSPQQIAGRLDDALGLLAGGNRTLPDRQQTLRATLDWSYALLEAGEQTLLRYLAVFAGGWTLEAAEAVCGSRDIPAGDVLSGLAQLVDKSLVLVEERGGAVRYRLLETIRQYADEKLREAGEERLLRARHCDWCLTLAERAEAYLASAQRRVWLERLEEEHDNLRAALNWASESGATETSLRLAGALQWFWYFRGYLAEGRAWLGRTLVPLGVSGHSAARAKALYATGKLAFYQGDYAAARTQLEESIALYRSLGDEAGVAYALIYHGVALEILDDYAAARAPLEESVALLQHLGDHWGLALALFYLGAIAAKQPGEEALARPPLQESAARFREMGDTWGSGGPLYYLGLIAQRLGDAAAARPYFEESLAAFREARDKWRIAVALSSLGQLAAAAGDDARTAALYGEALALARELGNKHLIVQSLEELASVAGAQRQAMHAARLFAAAGTLREGIGGEVIGAPLPPDARIRYDTHLAAVRITLGEATFAETWVAGRILSLEDVVDEALALVDAVAAPNAAAPAALSPREHEVVTLLVQGQTNAEIAVTLGIARPTAAKHVSNLLHKLGLSTRAELRGWAVENGLVPAEAAPTS